MTTDLLCFITSSSIILLIISCSKHLQTPFLPPAYSVVIILLISQWSCKNRLMQLVCGFNIIFWHSIVRKFFGFSVSSFLGRRRVNALANHFGISIGTLKALLNNNASSWRYEWNDLYQNPVIQSISGAPRSCFKG